ncbi:MAG: hypothetical protein AB1898_30505 [Acidobacteriota bacterium]
MCSIYRVVYMKGAVVCGALLCFMWSLAGADGSFPAPHGPWTLIENEKRPTIWAEKLLAFEGVVTEVVLDRGRPIFRLRLANQTAGDGLTLWAAYGSTGSAPAEVQDRVRVLGYLVKADAIGLALPRIPASTFILLSIAVLNVSTMKGSYLPGSEGQWNVWQKGRVPTAVRE